MNNGHTWFAFLFDRPGLLQILLVFSLQLLDDLLAVIGLFYSEHLGALCVHRVSEIQIYAKRAKKSRLGLRLHE